MLDCLIKCLLLSAGPLQIHPSVLINNNFFKRLLEIYNNHCHIRDKRK